LPSFTWGHRSGMEILEIRKRKKMKRKKWLKIGGIVALIVLIMMGIFVWRLAGQPYYRMSLLGTDYIENAAELSYANQHLDDKLILIKKYKYSKDIMFLGFGGGGSTTNDYFAYGVADSDKNILLEPNYQFISSKANSKKEVIIYGLPYVVNGNEKRMFYKVVDGNLIAIQEKESW